MIQVKMSPKEAQSFRQYSKNSVKTILMHRKCGCDPYSDWFTFKRWIAQGKCVKRGEHGIKLLVYTPSETLDDDGNEVIINKKFYSAWVFCRCQVHDIKNDGAAQPAAKPNEACTVNPNNTIPCRITTPLTGNTDISEKMDSFLANLIAANVSSTRGM